MTRPLLALLGLTCCCSPLRRPPRASLPPRRRPSGSAFAIQVVVPGQPGRRSRPSRRPPDAAPRGVRLPGRRLGDPHRQRPLRPWRPQPRAEPSVQSGADVISVSIFNGEITADGIGSPRAAGAAEGRRRPRDGSTGRATSSRSARRWRRRARGAALADWGTAVVLSGSASGSRRRRHGAAARR